jgi:hypothetical protein
LDAVFPRPWPGLCCLVSTAAARAIALLPARSLCIHWQRGRDGSPRLERRCEFLCNAGLRSSGRWHDTHRALIARWPPVLASIHIGRHRATSRQLGSGRLSTRGIRRSQWDASRRSRDGAPSFIPSIHSPASPVCAGLRTRSAETSPASMNRRPAA